MSNLESKHWNTTRIVTVISLTCLSLYVLTYQNVGSPTEHQNVISSKEILNGEMSVFLDSQMQDCIGNTANKSIAKPVTSARFSRIKITESGSSNVINLLIRTFNARNTTKSYGGDLLVVLGYQINGDGKVVGKVVDHKNGSYTGQLELWWTGQTRVKIKIGAMFENTCLRYSAIEKYGLSVYVMKNVWGIRGRYKAPGLEEYTPCSASAYVYGVRDFCNYTNNNDGMSWFCGRPENKSISCNDIFTFHSGQFMSFIPIMPHVEKHEKIVSPTVAYMKESFVVNVSNVKEVSWQQNNSCKTRPKRDTWRDIYEFPSGFWINGTWICFSCFSNSFHSAVSYRKCLNGKRMYILGDSTIRQYAEYFINTVLEYKPRIDLRRFGPDRTYHFRKTFYKYGINVVYLKHAMPFTNHNAPIKEITGFVTELEAIASSNITDSQIIIIAGYHAHFQLYPLAVYRGRIRKLVKSFTRLLTVKPSAQLFFKGPTFTFDDTHWFDNKMSITYMEIAFQEFAPLHNHVTFLDTWSPSVTLETSGIHPVNKAFQALIQQFMAYLC
ncbi:NXPE family member 3-like [Mya arenaria]|uniref:NXPE family member 3-like n=1 Tax=Mya arenaria TaxID=6604 RepID=UPI0022DF39A0|nr:NXPE family member 3-like [Mya arenaria]